MKIECTHAFKEMLRLFERFAGLLPSNQDDEWRRVEKYAAQLVTSGWTRKDVYDLVRGIENCHSDSMALECSDAIGNYMTALIGDVAPDCIVRLPGENGDIGEHTRYVRSKVWL